jgi:hypothetical protein
MLPSPETTPNNGLSDSAAGKDAKRRFFDWTILVIAVAFGITLAWIYLLFWATVRAVALVLN